MKRKRQSRAQADAEVEGSLRELARFARLARKNAHAPFSNFSVGAALKTFSGEIVTGCNIENATYGLTVCAERVAVFKAISEGIKKFEAIAIAAPSTRPAAPCGACRQILWEFCGDIWIHMDALRGKTLTRRLAELLPLPFDRRNL
jgi:cytidine deaminase